jgi:hypothetical protein
MKIPIEAKPAFWGVVGGAVALAIAGFGWGGWVTGGKAEAAAVQRADSAVVAALAANLSALKQVDTWSRGEFVEKGGWAKLPGSNSPEQVSAVAQACAVLLADG